MYRKTTPDYKKWLGVAGFIIEVILVILLVSIIFKMLFGSGKTDLTSLKGVTEENPTAGELLPVEDGDVLLDDGFENYHNDVSDIDIMEGTGEGYQYRIRYPVFANKEVFEDVFGQVQEMKDIFLMEERGREEEPGAVKSSFLVGCESYLSGEKIATVAFYTYKGWGSNNFKDKGIYLSLYDLDSGAEIKQKDVFYEGFEAVVSPLIVAYYQDHAELRAYTDTQLFKGNTKALPGNFKDFALAGDEVYFYFGSGVLFPAEYGVQKVTVARDSIEQVLKLNRDGSQKTLPPEPESAADLTVAEDTVPEPPEALVPEPTEPTPAASPETEPSITLEAATASVELDAERPMIAFTFDDGPYSPVTNRILDVLEAHGQKATFFVMGNRVLSYTQTLQRIYDSGNQVGNHSFNHKNFQNIPEEDVLWQMTYTNDLVEGIIGIRPGLVRVPYGAYKGQVTSIVKYPIIQWNVDTEDWRSKDCEAIVAEVRRTLADGNIILMHDLYPATAQAMEILVPELVEMGYQLVTVNDLFAAKGIPLEPGRVYYKGN